MAPAMSSEELLAALGRTARAAEAQRDATALRRFATEEKAAAPARPDTYPDIEQNTPEGKSVSLRSVVENPQNKYVLLDSGPRGAKPCMREVPHLKLRPRRLPHEGIRDLRRVARRGEVRWTEAIASNGMSRDPCQRPGGLRRTARARQYGVRGASRALTHRDRHGRIVASDQRSGAREGHRAGC